MKGAGKRFITILLLLLLFCSFTFQAYADDYKYMDKNSYFSGHENENPELIFFPLLPEERCSDEYLIIYYLQDGCYYLLFNTKDDFFYYASWYHFLSSGTMYVYKYNQKISNDWEYYGTWAPTEGPQFYKFIVIDSTKQVQSISYGSTDWQRMYQARTGYRLYWQLAIIEKSVLSWLNRISLYCLEREWLRYFILIGFSGEVIFFIVHLLSKVGELKNEE